MGGDVTAAIRSGSPVEPSNANAVAPAAPNACCCASGTAAAHASSPEVGATSVLIHTAQHDADGDNDGVAAAAAAAATAAATAAGHADGECYSSLNGVPKRTVAAISSPAAVSPYAGARSWHTEGNALKPHAADVVASANDEHAGRQAGADCGAHGDDTGDGHASWVRP